MFCTSGKEMGAPTGNWLYDSARDLTEMASMQFAVYGLMNPYTYQRPKITPLPTETGLTDIMPKLCLPPGKLIHYYALLIFPYSI